MLNENKFNFSTQWLSLQITPPPQSHTHTFLHQWLVFPIFCSLAEKIQIEILCAWVKHFIFYLKTWCTKVYASCFTDFCEFFCLRWENCLEVRSAPFFFLGDTRHLQPVLYHSFLTEVLWALVKSFSKILYLPPPDTMSQPALHPEARMPADSSNSCSYKLNPFVVSPNSPF